MEFVLTMFMCAFVEGKHTCLKPFKIEENYKDVYECLLDGYSKSYDKIVELGKDDVNKYNIYIKFGCRENISNKKST